MKVMITKGIKKNTVDLIIGGADGGTDDCQHLSGIGPQGFHEIDCGFANAVQCSAPSGMGHPGHVFYGVVEHHRGAVCGHDGDCDPRGFCDQGIGLLEGFFRTGDDGFCPMNLFYQAQRLGERMQSPLHSFPVLGDQVTFITDVVSQVEAFVTAAAQSTPSRREKGYRTRWYECVG